jgi:hypothetical protein
MAAVVHQYLTSATCAITFAVDRQIRYRVADIERAFQNVLGGQATGTNVADNAAPPIPRFTMQSGPKQLSVSQINAQLDLDFFNQKKSFETLSATVKKNFSNFWHGVCQFKNLVEIRDMGLILVFNTPDMRSSDELNSMICERYIRAPSLGQVASSAFQLGFLDSDKQAFINVAVGAYEVREGTVNQPDLKGSSGGAVTIMLDDLPVTERGIETKLDANSKPMERKNGELPVNLDEQLFQRLNGLVTDRFKEFLVW